MPRKVCQVPNAGKRNGRKSGKNFKHPSFVPDLEFDSNNLYWKFGTENFSEYLPKEPTQTLCLPHPSSLEVPRKEAHFQLDKQAI